MDLPIPTLSSKSTYQRTRSGEWGSGSCGSRWWAAGSRRGLLRERRLSTRVRRGSLRLSVYNRHLGNFVSLILFCFLFCLFLISNLSLPFVHDKNDHQGRIWGDSRDAHEMRSKVFKFFSFFYFFSGHLSRSKSSVSFGGNISFNQHDTAHSARHSSATVMESFKSLTMVFPA